MTDVLETDLLLLNRPDASNPKTYKINVSDLPSSSVSTGDVAPNDPKDGDLWWNTTDNTLYVYYNDGDTEQWVETNPGGGGGGSSSQSSGTFQVVDALPGSASFGDTCALTTNESAYFYDDTNWRRFYLVDATTQPDDPDPDWDQVLLRVPFNVDINDVKSGIIGGGDLSSIVGSPVKFGEGSLRVQGGNAFQYSDSTLDFLTVDFTIEFWIYFDSFATNVAANIPRGIFDKNQTVFHYTSNAASGSATVTFGIDTYNSGGSSTNFPNVASMSTGQWYHMAYTRDKSSGLITLYVNGTSLGTINGNDIVDSSSFNFLITDRFQSDSDFYIDDLRISTFERYTSDFNPPTSELPTKGLERLVSETELKNVLIQSSNFDQFKTGMLNLLQ